MPATTLRPYQFTPSPLLQVGPESLSTLSDQVVRLGTPCVLLVSDQGMAAAGWVANVQASLARQSTVALFLAPPGEPTVATVNAAAEAARALLQKQRCTVVGLGGGTALDIAKLAAAVAVAERPMDDYMMCAAPFSGRLPALMIPSTSGTGAEVTRTCVLTDSHGRKSWAWGDELRPDLALLDPALPVTLPPTLTATTGLDALVHAIEAATSQRTNAIAQSYALQAVRLIREALPTAVAAPDNLPTRLQMQEAACLAGLAIDQCGTGLAHNIGHALGTVAHLPHAVAVALAMQATLAWSIAGAPARYQPVADALHPGSSSTDLPELYAALLAAVDFAHACLPYRSPAPSAEALLDSMRSAENQPMLANNARVATPSDLAMLAHQVVALL